MIEARRTHSPTSLAALVLCVATVPLLAGCNDPRDCAFGISHRDCYPEGSFAARFPQDDAICRSYNLQPGTHDYAVCRAQKRHERALTDRATDFGVLEEPLTPDVRPVYQIR